MELKLGSDESSIRYLVEMLSLPHVYETLPDNARDFVGMLRLVDYLRCGIAQFYVPCVKDEAVGLVGGVLQADGVLMGQMAFRRHVKDTVPMALACEARLVEDLKLKLITTRIPDFNKASAMFIRKCGYEHNGTDWDWFVRDGQPVRCDIYEKAS